MSIVEGVLQCHKLRQESQTAFVLYHFSNITGIISLCLAERAGRVKAWQESEQNLGSAPQC
jgi:hypothetical protein